MDIAIIGGGAAGLVTAHLLDPHHAVTVFEKAPILGGHVRTLGGNVAAPDGVPCPLDAGVIEFDSVLFPHVHRLFQRLQVPVEPIPASTTLFLEGGRRLMAPGALARADLSWWRRLVALGPTLRLELARRRFERASRVDLAELYQRPLGDFLEASPWGRWLELLTMYAYSTPRPEVATMSAALVVPMLRQFSRAEHWFRVEGGVWAYMRRIVEGLRGETRCGVDVAAVTREGGRVRIALGDGTREDFDAVVLAVPPGEVPDLLADADPDERRRFAGWRTRRVQVLVHHDEGMYRRRGARFATEFDVFELPGGRGGYNALLNRLCAVPATDGRRFGLAFGMEEEIDPAALVHVQGHAVPVLSLEALRTREEIKAANGERGVWYAGAWLGDGLHEGAVTSALAVSRGLGGAVL